MRFSTYLDAIDEAAEVIRRNRVMKDGMVYHPFFTGKYKIIVKIGESLNLLVSVSGSESCL